MRYSLGLALAAILLCGGTSAADPVTVTSGTIVFTDEPGLFEVAGSGFHVRIGWFPTQESGTPFGDHCASGCVSGSTVDLGQTAYTFSDSFQGIGGIVNGVMYPALFSAGELTFNGPVFIAPAFDPDVRGIAEGAFTFHGSVSIFTDESRTGPPVFAKELTGQGTARVFGDVAGPGAPFVLLAGDDVHYRFASPVPEPSTVIMLVSGLIGGAARLSRRRRRGFARPPTLTRFRTRPERTRS
jgi:hypothetical protein